MGVIPTLGTTASLGNHPCRIRTIPLSVFHVAPILWGSSSAEHTQTIILHPPKVLPMISLLCFLFLPLSALCRSLPLSHTQTHEQLHTANFTSGALFNPAAYSDNNQPICVSVAVHKGSRRSCQYFSMRTCGPTTPSPKSIMGMTHSPRLGRKGRWIGAFFFPFPRQ